MSSNRLQPFFASMPSDEARKIGDIIRYLSLWMVFKDPPEHTRLRRLTSRVLHVKSMQGMRPQVEEIAEWLLDGMRGKDQFDFIAEFAGPLPCLVIMAMLGVPREDLAPDEAAVRRHGAVHRLVARLAREVRHRAGRHARHGRVLPRADRRAPRSAARRPAQRAGAPARRRRSPERGRAGGHLHPAALRRPRDHHQPHRQRAAVADAVPGRDAQAARRPVADPCRGRGAAAPRRPVGRAGAHRAGGAPAPRQDLEGRRPAVHDAQRRQPRPARLCRARPAGHRARRTGASHLRLRSAHLPGLPAGAHRRPGGLPGGAAALCADRAGRRPRSSG